MPDGALETLRLANPTALAAEILTQSCLYDEIAKPFLKFVGGAHCNRSEPQQLPREKLV